MALFRRGFGLCLLAVSTLSGLVMSAHAEERVFTFSSRPSSNTVILANGSDTITVVGSPNNTACFSVDTSGRVTSFALASTAACNQSITWSYTTNGFEVGRIEFTDIDDLDGDTARDGFAMNQLGTWSSPTLSTYAFTSSTPTYANQKARFTASGAVGTYLSRDSGTDPLNDQATFEFAAPSTSFTMIHDDLEGTRSARLFVELDGIQIFVVRPIVANAESFSSIDGGTGGTTGSVLASDTLDGISVDPNDVTITVDSSDPELTLNPSTGLISVAPNTAAGTYNVTYTICEDAYSPNCAAVTETVTVIPPPPPSCPAGMAYSASTTGFAGTVIQDATGGAQALGALSANGSPANSTNSARNRSSTPVLGLQLDHFVPAGVNLTVSIAKNNSGGDSDIDLSTSPSSGYSTQAVHNTGTQDVLTRISVPVPSGGAEYIRFSRNSGSTWIDGVTYTGACLDVDEDRSDAPITGTAPDGSNTNAYGEAVHDLAPGIRMGAAIDGDVSSLASPNANGDDTTGTDDEDGVTIPALTQGQSANISVSVTQATANSGYLQGWIDFNGNGSFDAAEQIATNEQFALGTSGTIIVSVAVPASATLNQTFARFRWSTTSGLNSTAAATDGEVEDYAVVISAAPPAPSNGTLNYPNSGTGTYLTNLALLDWENSSLDDGIDNGDIVEFPLIGCRVGTLTATFSNVTSPANASTYQPTDMQTWSGSSMYTAYNGPGAGEALYGGNNADTSFTVTWAMTVSGVSVSPDMFFLDAEATNGSGESLTAVTNGGNWAIADSAVGTNYTVSGIGTQTAVISKTEGPSHSPMLFTSETTQTDIAISAGGRQGIAFAVNIPCDYGDADSSYTSAAHAFKQEPAPTTGLQFKASEPYLGSNPPDSELNNQPSTLGDGDDNINSDDEDGLTIPALTQGETADIIVAVNQAAANVGYLQGWIDYDGDGEFEPSEQVATNTQLGTGASGNITVSVAVPSGATTSQTFLRFRWSTNIDLDSTSGASDGEVEDYAVTINAASAELTANKTVRLFDPANEGLYALPGNDVIYKITVTNVGGAAADADTIDLIDELPDDIEFWNGDIDAGGGSDFTTTDPVAFEDGSTSGLTFTYASDVRFSTSTSKPADFFACNIVAATSTYRPDFNYICFNPKGVFVAGDPDPEFSVSFRARIK